MGLHISFHDPIKSIKSCPLSAEALQYLVIPPRKKKSKLLSMVYKARCHLTLTLTMFPLPDYDCPAFLFFWRAVLDEPGDNRRELCSLPFLLPVCDALTPHLGLATSFPSLDSQMSFSQRPFLTTPILSSPITLLNLSHHFLHRPSVHFQFSHSVVSNSLQSHGLQHASLPCPLPIPRAY